MSKPADEIREPQAAYATHELRTSVRREHLIAGGRLKPATVDLFALGRPQDEPHAVPISQALNELRVEG